MEVRHVRATPIDQAGMGIKSRMDSSGINKKEYMYTKEHVSATCKCALLREEIGKKRNPAALACPSISKRASTS
jgi:hypothetical protein